MHLVKQYLGRYTACDQHVHKIMESDASSESSQSCNPAHNPALSLCLCLARLCLSYTQPIVQATLATVSAKGDSNKAFVATSRCAMTLQKGAQICKTPNDQGDGTVLLVPFAVSTRSRPVASKVNRENTPPDREELRGTDSAAIGAQVVISGKAPVAAAYIPAWGPNNYALSLTT